MVAVFLFLLLALVLLFLEFYLPGGVLAFFSAATFIVSLAFLVQQGCSVFEVVLYMVISMLLAAGTVAFALSRIKKSADSNTFFLSSTQKGFVGSTADETLVGRSGIAKTDLGPSGFAEIEGKRVQVISCGPYIDRGEKIVVISARGAYLVVQKG